MGVCLHATHRTLVFGASLPSFMVVDDQTLACLYTRYCRCPSLRIIRASNCGHYFSLHCSPAKSLFGLPEESPAVQQRDEPMLALVEGRSEVGQLPSSTRALTLCC